MLKEYPVIISPVPHLIEYCVRFDKNLFH